MAARDLFISSFAPRLENGRALRTYTLVAALSATRPVDLAYVPFDGGPSAEYLALENVRFHEITPSRGLRRLSLYARRRAVGVPVGCARACSPEIIDTAKRLAAETGRGRVIAGDLNVMAALLGVARRTPVVYSAHNVESSYEDNPFEGRITWLPMRVTERRMLLRAAESWMVSEIDVRRARELAPAAKLRYVPNVVDVDAIAPVTAAPGSRTITMIGDFTYPPNAGGVAYLAEQIMPLVWERLPDARLRIVGRGLEHPPAPDPRIEVLGFIDDIRDAYAGSAAIAVPLLESVGTPLKFVEALAYGVPVVATPRSAQGLAVVDGEHYRAGADRQAFADALVDVVSSGAAEMARRGRELAQREYSLTTLRRLVAA